MNCIEEIAKDAKVIEIDNQLLVLIKRQVDTELMLGEKFRDLCEGVSYFVKDIKDVVKEVERLSCKDVREINADLQFVVGLSQPWDVLYNRVNEIKMLSSELNLFGGPLAVQCAEYLKQLSKSEVLRMLELMKTIAEVHI
uniref:Uncharacterized protein n=1 Tax=Tanacetum cinerariifolium TaxID=118510 RepID=A0A699H1M4_TANCI|nr:hypothetical protein [Tanacetum cinerariifolium]